MGSNELLPHLAPVEWGREHDVATLDVRGDFREAAAPAQFPEFTHREPICAADVDGAQEDDEDRHSPESSPLLLLEMVARR